MYIDEHGGGCCGVSHIWGFDPVVREQELDRRLKKAFEFLHEEGEDEVWDPRVGEYVSSPKCREGQKEGHLIEATLTDAQMVVWASTLKRKGFKLVHRFYNHNSGNHVSLLTYCPRKTVSKRPFKW